MEMLASSPGQTDVINVSPWLSRTTMDTIGEAAFDYQFGALANSGVQNEFMEAYLGLTFVTNASGTSRSC